jgi:hypothetical protein
MKPIKFKGSNIIFAENQTEYLPLPAWKDDNGLVISCWKLTLKERIRLCFIGKIWLRILTFNNPLQPQRMDINYPFKKTNGGN